MAETPIYVYGVTAAETLRVPLRAQGLPDGRSPVAAIAVAGASAIVGRYEGPTLTGLPRADLLSRLAIHQKVIEDVLAIGDVLPAQFGTVLPSEDEVRLFLTGWGALVRASLARFSGLVEVEVAGTWNLERILGEVACDPEIVAAKSAASQAAPQERLSAQINIGKSVKELLDRRRAVYQEMLLKAVEPLADGLQPNVLLSDELVFNVAFLVKRQAVPELEAAIDRLDAELAGSLALRIIGPLPPYTFGTVSIRRFDAERLAAGRALLGLAGEISEEAVLAGYRERAKEFHPDSHRAGHDAAGRFAALGDARADLLAYSRSPGRVNGADGGTRLMVTIGREPDDGAAGGGRR